MLLHSQHRFHRHNSRRSLLPLNLWRLPIVVFGFRTYSHCRWGVLHRIDYCMCRHHHVYYSNYIFGGIAKIVLRRSTRWWKPHSHQRPHARSRAAQSFCVSLPRVSLSPNWCHPWLHQCHVSLNYVSIQSFADVSATSSADVICWLLTALTRTVDRWLLPAVDFEWPLTFLQGCLLQSRFSLPNFSRRFHFCNLFLHIMSLNG